MQRIGASRDTGLLSCIALALLMHGLLLAPIWRSQAHAGLSGQWAGRSLRPAPMQVSTLTEARLPAAITTPDPVAAAVPAPKLSKQESSKAAAKVLDDGSSQVPDVWPSLQEGQVLINYPDAPLPGGRLRMRVLVQLDAAGRIETLESDMSPDVPAVFFEAVRLGLSDSTFSPGYLLQRAVASSLCLEVVFDERHPGVTASLLDAALGSRKDCLGAERGQASPKLAALQPDP